MPVLPGHRRTRNGECRGGAGSQVAPEAAGVAGGTVEAARENSNSAGGDTREEETTGEDCAREERAAGPASEKEGRPVAVTGRGEDADDRAAEMTG